MVQWTMNYAVHRTRQITQQTTSWHGEWNAVSKHAEVRFQSRGIRNSGASCSSFSISPLEELVRLSVATVNFYFYLFIYYFVIRFRGRAHVSTLQSSSS